MWVSGYHTPGTGLSYFFLRYEDLGANKAGKRWIESSSCALDYNDYS